MSNLGDIPNNEILRQIDPQIVNLGVGRWIVTPEWRPPVISGMEPVQALIEKHIMQRLWQLAQDNYTLLKRGTFRIQKPGWIEQPITSEPEDRVSETPVALSNGTAVVVVTYSVPDNHYAVFKWFGHLLDVSSQWGVVTWTIRVNQRPYRTYNNFIQQRGSVVDPTPIAKPIVLKPKDILEVVATGGPTAVNAIARIMGWSIAASQIVQDGSWKGLDVR